MATAIKLLGISGALRKGSTNTALLRAAAEMLPEGVTMEIASIADIPMYDGDVEAQGVPAAVQAFKDKIKAADALLFATPEYNFSIPGVLKNAIDWASRPPNAPVLPGKPAAIIGAAGGPMGTGRSQYHLRMVLSALDVKLINKPEVFVGASHTKVDAEGKLTDPVARDLIKQVLVNLAAWTRKLRGEA
jgi:chromate reductase